MFINKQKIYLEAIKAILLSLQIFKKNSYQTKQKLHPE